MRASKGAISSGEAFWLIPAMRRKERSGPGIVRFAEIGDCAEASCDEEEESAPRAGGTRLEQVHKETATRAGMRNEGFMAGALYKPWKDLRNGLGEDGNRMRVASSKSATDQRPRNVQGLEEKINHPSSQTKSF